MGIRHIRWKAVAAAVVLAFATLGAARAAENASANASERAALRVAQGGDSGSNGSGKSLIVFAAASLTDVLGEIDKAYTAKTGVVVKASFAASSALARQIENGAKAEVFFSADEEWMNYLATRNLLQPNSATMSSATGS